jgi:glycosyltransferase involved in cell wall biosynthesis
MSHAASDATMWVERLSGLGHAGIWLIAARRPAAAGLAGWLPAAEQTFSIRPETASVVAGGGDVLFISGLVGDLIGLTADYDRTHVTPARVQQWLATATSKGLAHSSAGAAQPAQPSAPLALGIDAAWLLGGESGAQVFVDELLKALAPRPDIARIVLLSDAGAVPRALEGDAKITGLSWSAALARRGPFLDIMHRPYQPGIGVDYRRYHHVAPCVAITVLDFIAYDNRQYHESEWAWRDYQKAFDDQICLADGVFAISAHVALRLTGQFAHQLAGPVRVVPLGTDHVRHASAPAGSRSTAALQVVEDGRFLLVLGSDFEHKNRDFAVKVFADMCERGYEGRLVLAGHHLDSGSSFGHELAGAGRYRDRVIRIGAVSPSEKLWLLGRTEAVLYPTSAEGFGLIPFEAAAFGRPTAFVRFGPLSEMLPQVDACVGWRIRPFADHVFRLIGDPAANVAQIRAAAESLTWARAADLMIDGYRDLLSPAAPWRTRTRRATAPGQLARRGLEWAAYRASNAIRRRLWGRSGNG